MSRGGVKDSQRTCPSPRFTSELKTFSTKGLRSPSGTTRGSATTFGVKGPPPVPELGPHGPPLPRRRGPPGRQARGTGVAGARGRGGRAVVGASGVGALRPRRLPPRTDAASVTAWGAPPSSRPLAPRVLPPASPPRSAWTGGGGGSARRPRPQAPPASSAVSDPGLRDSARPSLLPGAAGAGRGGAAGGRAAAVPLGQGPRRPG